MHRSLTACAAPFSPFFPSLLLLSEWQSLSSSSSMSLLLAGSPFPSCIVYNAMTLASGSPLALSILPSPFPSLTCNLQYACALGAQWNSVKKFMWTRSGQSNRTNPTNKIARKEMQMVKDWMYRLSWCFRLVSQSYVVWLNGEEKRENEKMRGRNEWRRMCTSRMHTMLGKIFPCSSVI